MYRYIEQIEEALTDWGGYMAMREGGSFTYS